MASRTECYYVGELKTNTPDQIAIYMIGELIFKVRQIGGLFGFYLYQQGNKYHFLSFGKNDFRDYTIVSNSDKDVIDHFAPKYTFVMKTGGYLVFIQDKFLDEDNARLVGTLKFMDDKKAQIYGL